MPPSAADEIPPLPADEIFETLDEMQVTLDEIRAVVQRIGEGDPKGAM